MPLVTLALTTPQACIVMAFDNHKHSRNHEYNEKNGMKDLKGYEEALDLTELSEVTGLYGEELQYVIKSLCDISLPLLEILPDGNNYVLSNALRSGSLGAKQKSSSSLVWESCAVSEIGIGKQQVQCLGSCEL